MEIQKAKTKSNTTIILGLSPRNISYFTCNNKNECAQNNTNRTLQCTKQYWKDFCYVCTIESKARGVQTERTRIAKIQTEESMEMDRICCWIWYFLLYAYLWRNHGQRTNEPFIVQLYLVSWTWAICSVHEHFTLEKKISLNKQQRCLVFGNFHFSWVNGWFLPYSSSWHWTFIFRARFPPLTRSVGKLE